MAIIKKKTWPEQFKAVLSGKKNYDLRVANFDVSEGDTLILEEWDPATKAYTGRAIEKTVTYVGKFRMDELFGQDEGEIKEKGIQVMALKDFPVIR